MEDEHQSTLKKKIQILFQLGKWPDVVKLCDSYGEKYGKDIEIDMIRFKSERHMGIPAPTATPGAEAGTGVPENKVQRQEPVVAETVISDPTIPLIPPTKADELAFIHEEKLAYDSSPDSDDLDVGDPFSENELVITDPFADDSPGFSLAPEPSPVVINESHDDAQDAGSADNDLEMEGAMGAAPDAQPQESEPDFSNVSAMTIDAEPDLGPSMPEMKPRPEPAARLFHAAEEETLLETPAAAGGSFDYKEEPGGGQPALDADPFAEEKTRRPPAPVPEMPAEKAPARKRVFGFKLVLLVVLPLAAAAALWLALSGKLDFSGAQESPVIPQPVVRPPVRKKPERVKPVVPPAPSAEALAREKEFSEKLRQAGELDRQGDVLKALAVLVEAKKIKETEPLLQLEERLKRKMQEAEEQARKETEFVQNQSEKESQAFAKAEAEDTIVAWNVFLSKFPNGEMTARAGRRIAVLEKKVQDSAQQQLQARVQQAQKARLRAFPSNLSQADIAAMARRGVSLPAQFESLEHGGAKVMLDLTTGLMWTLWNKPMAYDKAKWWANRVTAGYGGWRLPTAEEALSLLQINRELYAGLADFVVWTGDAVSDQTRTAWAMKMPGGQFLAADHTQIHYVWAVRKAGK
jgi:hypothetical protein